MNVNTQLRGATIGILIIAVCNVFSVFINETENDGRVINNAGIIRGGSQRLVKLELAGKSNDALIEKLNKILNGLINGDSELNLPPATDRDFLTKMKKVESAWINLKNTIRKARQEPQYRNALIPQSEEYFELTNDAVFSAAEYAAEKAQRLKVIELVVFGLNLIILAIILVIARNITLILQKSIDTIATTSTEIAASVEKQERTASQQAASVRQVTTTINELGASSRHSAEQAEASSSEARQALVLAEGGTKTVRHTLDEMSLLQENVRELVEQIMRLSEQTNQIGGISGLVRDSASQTNMLAINAAVEAARAGEHGKGFGVVAGEIRKLADQSKKSAEKINTLVTDIQNAINSTVIISDKGTKAVAEGMQMTCETAESFTGVTHSINNIFLNSQQISLNTKQHAIATEQVADAMSNLTLAAQETASGITQIKVGTQHLKGAAQNLKAMV